MSEILAHPKGVGLVIFGDNIAPPARLAMIRRLQAARVKVLAYASTRQMGTYDPATFGTRPLLTVEAQIRHAERTYHPDGIFLDNVPSGLSRLAYFRELSRYVRSLPGRFLVLNGAASASYLPLADVLVEFEGYYRDFIRWRPGAWVHSEPASRSAAIVHTVPGARAGGTARHLARRDNVGYLFVTDRRFPLAYAGLPRLAAQRCAGAGA